MFVNIVSKNSHATQSRDFTFDTTSGSTCVWKPYVYMMGAGWTSLTSIIPRTPPTWQAQADTASWQKRTNDGAGTWCTATLLMTNNVELHAM